MALTSGRTGFARVDALITSAEQSLDWDKANTECECHLYQVSSAMNLNFFEPFTPEQIALNNYLTRRRAGKRLCDYAWRLYAHSLT